jgi:hypothetical protein
MNLYHVQREESWKHAEKACRSEFIEAMRDCDYGASETLDAWGWFVLGWYKGGGIPKRPVSA